MKRTYSERIDKMHKFISKKETYVLSDLTSLSKHDSKHASIRDAKDRAKISWGIKKNAWVWDKTKKVWTDGYDLVIKKLK